MADPDSIENLMRELQQDYFATFQEKIQGLQLYYEQKDWKNLELEFHKLKGTGTTYGVPQVSQLCAPLEELCRQQTELPPKLFQGALILLKDIQKSYETQNDLKLENLALFKKIKVLSETLS